jgi:hypothetical protein
MDVVVPLGIETTMTVKLGLSNLLSVNHQSIVISHH